MYSTVYSPVHIIFQVELNFGRKAGVALERMKALIESQHDIGGLFSILY